MVERTSGDSQGYTNYQNQSHQTDGKKPSPMGRFHASKQPLGGDPSRIPKPLPPPVPPRNYKPIIPHRPPGPPPNQPLPPIPPSRPLHAPPPRPSNSPPVTPAVKPQKGAVPQPPIQTEIKTQEVYKLIEKNGVLLRQDRENGPFQKFRPKESQHIINENNKEVVLAEVKAKENDESYLVISRDNGKSWKLYNPNTDPAIQVKEKPLE